MANTWTIPEIWDGGECFIIGGGSSLDHFPWGTLRDKKTIGCNNAFELGAEICNYCIFGDWGFSEKFSTRNNSRNITFRDYGSLVITNARKLKGDNQLKVVKRTENHSIADNTELGWYGNTGITAIELAIKFGARKIYLLGYDMSRSTKDMRVNWYENIRLNPTCSMFQNQLHKKDAYVQHTNKLFGKFIRNFQQWENYRKELFPKVKIINANPKSGLEIYEKVAWETLLL